MASEKELASQLPGNERLRILRRTYALTEPDLSNGVPQAELLQDLDLDHEQALALLSALLNDGFLSRLQSGRWRITHLGLEQVQGVSPSPARLSGGVGTATLNIHGSVGAVQTGNHNTATVTMTIGPSAQDLSTLLGQLRAQRGTIPAERREEFDAEVDDLEAELTRPERKANWAAKVTSGLTRLTALGTGVSGLLKVVDDIRTHLDKVVP